ncbi:MAG TPA: protein kinase [Steroidobacteraceae bacterium]|jgi:serine/threonine protein kinase|nr:protein kinase [Steroidobacteraceae bacterium]
MRKLSAQDWRQLFGLLDTALDLPPPAREAWLSTLTDQPAHLATALRELLARQTSQETNDFLRQVPQFTFAAVEQVALGASETAAAGSTVGAYRLIRELGRGGMSAVWVAERTDGLLKRHVALKLPHLSWRLPDLAGRMARERDILASLEHPNIARLYDAGVGVDGRPYLALELIDGKPIDEYCREQRADIPTRVAIALQTAHAVAYAHSRFVVHRDLKPSNILVDAAGQVHLLDFGIGKLLEQDPASAAQVTQFGNPAFTPDYASPEQLRGETVTALTDVYSFGVVLYELLSGARPFPPRTAPASIENVLTRGDPRPPSKNARNRVIARALQGDLDTIILKAMKESPLERYASMSAVVADLERHLRSEPLIARGDSAWYRLRKFAARNRFVLRAVTAAIAVTVAISAGLAIERARQQSAETARAVDDFSDNLAQLAVPRTPPTKDVVAYREYLQARGLMIVPTVENLREVIRLTTDATARDPTFARAYAVLAGGYLMHLDSGYSRPDALTMAEPAVRQALALDPRIPGAHASLGVIAAHRGDWLAAEAHFKTAFELDDGSGRIHARYAEAVLNSTGRLREALRIFQVELRKTPTHCRGAMQVAVAFGTQPGHDSAALHYVDVAMSHGWPGNSRDVAKLNGEIARRAGRHAESAEYQAMTIPAAARQAGGVEVVRLLNDALADPSKRLAALASLDALNAKGASAGMDTFEMLMLSMSWYTALGEVDTAYLVSERWLAEVQRTGSTGIPFNIGFWLPEMRPFRADPRFQELARRMKLMTYWQKFSPPDDCQLQRDQLSCH